MGITTRLTALAATPLSSATLTASLSATMADAAAPAKATPKKAAKAKKTPKTPPAAHPPFAVMVMAAIKALADKKGSSRAAIKKYILANYKVDEKKSRLITKALRKAIDAKTLTQAKGQANGLIKLAEKAKAAKSPKKPAKKAAKSPKKAAPKAKKAAKKKKAAPKKK